MLAIAGCVVAGLALLFTAALAYRWLFVEDRQYANQRERLKARAQR